jgi:hypothetical protein
VDFIVGEADFISGDAAGERVGDEDGELLAEDVGESDFSEVSSR